MINSKSLEEANNKLFNITNDINWIQYASERGATPLFCAMALKSLSVQIKDVEKIFDTLINELEESK